jgi:very-short-patch-repair endonuclease
MKADEKLHRLADAQLGLICTDQLPRIGLTPRQIATRVQHGTLEWLSPRVLRVVGARTSTWQRALAASLDAGEGSSASHTTAAALFRHPGYSVDPVHVTRAKERNKRPSNLGIVHEPKLLLPSHLTRRGPLPITSPSRTLFDIAAMVHIEKLARTVDGMIVRRYTNTTALHQMLRVLQCRGRTGITAMRAVLADRPIGYKPPESRLEAQVAQAIEHAGLPRPNRQVDVGDDEGWIARVDFLLRPVRLIIFVDGDFWHSTLSDRANDAVQQARLERAGFSVVRIDETTVVLRPHEIARIVEVRARELGINLRSAGASCSLRA